MSREQDGGASCAARGTRVGGSVASGLTRVERIISAHVEREGPGDTGCGSHGGAGSGFHANAHAARIGGFVRIRPHRVMTHDNTSAVIPKFHGLFGSKDLARVADSAQPVFAIDHDIQNRTPDNLGKYLAIERFAHRHGIEHHPAGSGIGHQVMIEMGHVLPGTLVVGSDSHSNMYGAVGALGAPVVRTDAACIWATRSTWWRVPQVTRVRFEGRLVDGATGKDVILTLCALFPREVVNHAVEFDGPGLAALGMSERMTIANMTTEWGAAACVFDVDELTRGALLAWGRRAAESGRSAASQRLRAEHVEQAMERAAAWRPAEDAGYARTITIDLSRIRPHVTGPHGVSVSEPVDVMAGRRVRIDRAYLLSCVNARVEDLSAAADVFRRSGGRVAGHVRFYVAAASAWVEQESRRRGDWDVLVGAGAMVLPPGCGPCIGLGEGTVEAGEVAISATNRNFRGRMGSREASVYLASPAVVAASALAGWITGPGVVDGGAAEAVAVGETARSSAESPVVNVLDHRSDGRGNGEGLTGVNGSLCASDRLGSAGARGDASGAGLLEGFPEELRGRALLALDDDINTDGIYAGRWTYREDLTSEQMASVLFENYRPELGAAARAGDILLAGHNFGCGSSREQAATALLCRGIRAVVAASLNDTYARNAFNNGLMAIECAPLIESVRAASVEGTITGRELVLDFVRGVAIYDGCGHAFAALPAPMQALIAAGGAEAVARARLAGDAAVGAGGGR